MINHDLLAQYAYKLGLSDAEISYLDLEVAERSIDLLNNKAGIDDYDIGK